jgi:hypothetical protein
VNYDTKVGTPEYNAGSAARRSGKPLTANPYSRFAQAQLFRAWRKGWKDTNDTPAK